MLSFASPGTLLGLALGGFIGAAWYCHRIVVGRFSWQRDVQVGRANEERIIAAFQQLNRITAQSESTDENQ